VPLRPAVVPRTSCSSSAARPRKLGGGPPSPEELPVVSQAAAADAAVNGVSQWRASYLQRRAAVVLQWMDTDDVERQPTREGAALAVDATRGSALQKLPALGNEHM